MEKSANFILSEENLGQWASGILWHADVWRPIGYTEGLICQPCL